MPRSRRRIDTDNRAIERGKEVVKDALKDFTGKYQAAVIALRIQGNSVWSGKVEQDRPLVRYLWGEGLKILIRDALAEWGFTSSPEDKPPQLELFAEDERALVRQIGLARIWVPSREAHIPYHAEPADVLEEAAAYYESLGLGTVRKARLMRRLAAMRRGLPPERIAA